MNAEEQRVHDKAMDMVCRQGEEIARLKGVIEGLTPISVGLDYAGLASPKVLALLKCQRNALAAAVAVAEVLEGLAPGSEALAHFREVLAANPNDAPAEAAVITTTGYSVAAFGTVREGTVRTVYVEGGVRVCPVRDIACPNGMGCTEDCAR